MLEPTAIGRTLGVSSIDHVVPTCMCSSNQAVETTGSAFPRVCCSALALHNVVSSKRQSLLHKSADPCCCRNLPASNRCLSAVTEWPTAIGRLRCSYKL